MHGRGDGVTIPRDDSSDALQGVADVPSGESTMLLADSERGAVVRAGILGCSTEMCSEDGVLLQNGVEQLLEVGDMSPAGLGKGRTRTGLRESGRPMGWICGGVGWLSVVSTTPCCGGVAGCAGDLCNDSILLHTC